MAGKLGRETESTEGKESGLTDRQKTVVRLLSDGLSYQKIATKLGIKFTAVRTHIQRSIHKAKVSNKYQLIAWFARRR